jgi:hypothetical protein
VVALFQGCCGSIRGFGGSVKGITVETNLRKGLDLSEVKKIILKLSKRKMFMKSLLSRE